MKKLLEKLNKKLLLFTLVGVFIGIVGLAVTEGAINATDTPEFCASCHVYERTITTFNNSNHAALNCNDCHAPTDSKIAKYTFKGISAVSHGYMTTIGASKIPDVIHATAKSREIIEKNCISCHEPGLQNISHDAKGSCIDCHRQVPHMSGDFRPDEWFEPGNFEFNR
ncbi:nitrate reductase [Anaerobacillus alkalilacustris]|uniref:Cytochrome c-type protein n=1 Tax=Anaerobacillus alkalilacustris TaxID=393763 RepID=A0A1S2LYM4_9BACI|nr:NapC/NirT family cytochrome c [Anaerobacillus alkalilacustris]OIJ17588.1 nitrate reductase [Anaerobacillus alkalilacustris]